MLSRSWSEFSINFSQNTAWDLSNREHWWDLINFESILFLSSLILCLSKTIKYLARPSKWTVEFTVWKVLLFFVPEEIANSFFNFFFDILEQYKFGLSITAWKQGFGFWLYFYLSKRVSLYSRYGLFANLELWWASPLLSGGGSWGGWASNHIFIKGELDRSSTFRGGCWERGRDFN